VVEIINAARVLDVRFDGRSLDVRLADLDLATGLSDTEVKLALARRLDVSEESLHDYVVDRHPTGNLTVRPQVVLGYQ
jgi:hypothetical protein